MSRIRGLFRQHHQLAEHILNSWDAASYGRRQATWAPGDRAPSDHGGQIVLIRNRARDAYRNNPIVRAAVNKVVSDFIGTGIGCRPHSGLPASLRARMVTGFEDWAAEADYDRLTDWYGLQAAAELEYRISGEAILLLEPDPVIGLKLRLLEPDHLPFGRSTDGRIIDGIELDSRGRRIAYHLYPKHPAEGYSEPTRIPAERVIHLYRPERPGQLRGVSPLAPVLARIHALDSFDDAVLERQRLANLYLAFVTKPAPEIGGLGGPEADPAPIDMAPGIVQELLPGEDIRFAAPPEAAGHEGFSNAQLHRVSEALGPPYFLLSGDYGQVNDRTARVAMTAYRRQLDQDARARLIPRLIRPVRQAWVRSQVLLGALPTNRTLADLERTDYILEAWAYLHPVQDVQAEILAIEGGLKSRAESLLSRGRDAEEVDAERAQDQEREQRLGLSSIAAPDQGAGQDDPADD